VETFRHDHLSAGNVFFRQNVGVNDRIGQDLRCDEEENDQLELLASSEAAEEWARS